MKTFFEQTTENDRQTIALLLGFKDGDDTGFRINLQDMGPLPSGWNYGDALKAYCLFLINQ